MYVASTEEALQDVAVICTLLIHTAPTTILFYPGSTCTFIAKIFVDWIGVFVEDLGYDVVVFYQSVREGCCCAYLAIHLVD